MERPTHVLVLTLLITLYNINNLNNFMIIMDQMTMCHVMGVNSDGVVTVLLSSMEGFSIFCFCLILRSL